MSSLTVHRGLWRALLLLALALRPAGAAGEVLVRWDQDAVPSPGLLGVSTLVVPAGNSAAIRAALGLGYRIVVEVDAAALSGFIPPAGVSGVVVKGQASAARLALLRKRMKEPGARVLSVLDGGKWPHIRSNWVTTTKGVLQVASRSAQPWIENNAALLALVRPGDPDSAPLLSYVWAPVTLADADEGPGLENYLVAIAEAGSFGGDLLLPLHERFQKALLLGQPDARRAWQEVRRYIDFYGWARLSGYERIAGIGVVAAEPLLHFETLNLLARHNLPFELVDPAHLPARNLDAFEALIVLDAPDSTLAAALGRHAARGRDVVIAGAGGARPWRSAAPAVQTAQRVVYPVGEGRVVEVPSVNDPNAFALDIRQLLGPDRRPLDIWNGITVMAASYRAPGGDAVMVTAVNYAHQPLPVQVRVRGRYGVVQYESPGEPAALLPHQHRNGGTEFVLPALRVGARVFLSSREPGDQP